MTLNLKTKNNESWWILSRKFSSLQTPSNSVCLKFCWEESTGRILTFWVGINYIPTQNIIRKLTNLIKERQSQLPIQLYNEEETYVSTKSYQKFLKENSNVCQVRRIDDFDSVDQQQVQTEMWQRLDRFHKFSWEGTSLDQLLQTMLDCQSSTRKLQSKMQTYVDHWNSQLQTWEGNVSNDRISKAEIVEQTPFDEQFEKIQKQKDFDALQALQEIRQIPGQLAGMEFLLEEIYKNTSPSVKKKTVPQELRDPIDLTLFHCILLGAGASTKYQTKIRRAQLRIAYVLLYYLGLRLNELRPLSLQKIKESMKSEILRVQIFKTNKSKTYTLPKEAQEELKKLRFEFELLQDRHGFQYLFGKGKPMHEKSLLRIVNQDLKYTCQTCRIQKKIQSHSFRISVISRLLMVTSVQEVADLIGHEDIRSTMRYTRYRLSKSEIQELHTKAEEKLKNLQKS